MPICYKLSHSTDLRRSQQTILQTPDGLQNPRETKAFAIGNRAGKWSITAAQTGNNFAHTLRDGSQEMYEGKVFNHIGIDRILQNGSFSVKIDGGQGSYVDLTKARPEVAEFRSPLCS